VIAVFVEKSASGRFFRFRARLRVRCGGGRVALRQRCRIHYNTDHPLADAGSRQGIGRSVARLSGRFKACFALSNGTHIA
jgi:hypothetical protein